MTLPSEIAVSCDQPQPRSRRFVLARLAGALALAVAHDAWAAPSPPDPGAFHAFLLSLAPAAQKAGVSRAVFAATLQGLEPDPALLKQSARQPEFETPLWVYLRTAAGPARVAQGRRAQRQWASQLAAIARKSGVSRDIVLAAWGMESDFSEVAQTRDVVRSLATLAYARPQTPSFKTEFVAALVMIDRHLASRAELRGSWAGAMGMPQFMPSAYLKYAVRYEGRGAADIWSSVPDSLASIANFLAKSGWTRGLPWGFEVTVPPGFAWRSLHEDFATWRGLGLKRADGAPFPARGAADLFAPAGASGPAFLLCANYWILKKYNNSDSYALSLGILGDRIAGRPGVRKAWPQHVRPLARADRIRLQKSLAALGFYRGLTDGKIGPATRKAVHAFQVKNALQPADGFATPTVLASLESRRARGR